MGKLRRGHDLQTASCAWHGPVAGQVSFEAINPTAAKALPENDGMLEHLLRQQLATLENLLADQQHSVQRLFNDHQQAIQRIFVEAARKPVPLPKISQKDEQQDGGRHGRVQARVLKLEQNNPCDLWHTQYHFSPLARQLKLEQSNPCDLGPVQHHFSPLVRELKLEQNNPCDLGHAQNHFSPTDEDDFSSNDADATDSITTSTTSRLHNPCSGVSGHALAITKSGYFMSFMSIAVMSYTVYLGYVLHIEITDTLNKFPKDFNQFPQDFKFHHVPGSDEIAMAFLTVFLIEMAVRIVAEQRQFCCGPTKYWNALEVFCLVTMVMEQFMPRNSGMLRNAGMLRLFRILRIIPAARALRLASSMKRLRVMLMSVFSCIVSMLWALLLLLLFVSLYAFFLEDTSLAYLKEAYEKDLFDNSTVLVVKELREHWNGMGCTVRSLIGCISGGESWSALAEPFWTISFAGGISFIGFILLMMFGLLNILIGVFVQEADSTRAEQEEEFSHLFDALDLNGNGVLNLDEILKGFQDENIAAKFEALDVRFEMAEELFKILDVDGSNSITRLEFVQGLAKLDGKKNSSVDVLIEGQKVIRKLDQLEVYISQRLDPLVTPGNHVGGYRTSGFSVQPGGWNAWQDSVNTSCGTSGVSPGVSPRML